MNQVDMDGGNGIGDDRRNDLRRDLESNGGQIAQVALLTEQAMKPGWLDCPGDSPLKIMVRPNGETDDVWVPPRSYTAFGIDGFAAMVRDIASVGSLPSWGEAEGNAVRVFVGESEAVAVFDERGSRTHTVRMGLSVLESAKMLSRGNLSNLDQKTIVWYLRSVYAGRFLPASLLPVLRKLKIKGGSGGGSTVEHGRETRDLSIEAEITGVSEGVPEEVVLSTAVFAELADGEGESPEFACKCALRINLEDSSFTIAPLEGEVARMMRAARSEVAARIRQFPMGDNVVVFEDAAR